MDGEVQVVWGLDELGNIAHNCIYTYLTFYTNVKVGKKASKGVHLSSQSLYVVGTCKIK